MAFCRLPVRLLCIAAFLLLTWGGVAHAITVTTTSDSGTGSLRAAITYANAHPGTTISFNMTGTTTGGVYVFKPSSALPNITANGTLIDGRTQTLISNSNPSGPERLPRGS